MKVNIEELKTFRDNLIAFRDSGMDEFCKTMAKELAARLMSKTVKRTPVGQYPPKSHKLGGTLRRGWHLKQETGADGVNAIKVNTYECTYVVELVNDVEYAIYVEYGHRTANHASWVDGQFMMTISLHELETQANALIEKKLIKKIKEELRFD